MRCATSGDCTAVPFCGVRSRSRAGRRRFRETLFLLCVLVTLLRPSARVISASSWLVAERPDHFLIFNKYQQQITPRERAMLAAFVPMRIIRNNDVLSDGFTSCMVVEIGGELFYIAKGKDGELSGSEHAGAIRRVNAGADLGDTIVVLTGGAFQVSSTPGVSRPPLPRGEKLVRYFQEGDRTYVGTLDQRRVFGYVRLPSSGRGLSWDHARSHAALGPAEIPQRLLAAVRENLDGVNKVYQALYAYFNTQTGEQRPVPRWNMTSAHGTIVCTRPVRWKTVSYPADRMKFVMARSSP